MTQHHDPAIPRLVLDVETYGTVDLTKSGAHAYAEHARTGIHCLAWSITCFNALGAVDLWLPGHPVPPLILGHVRAGLPIIAHNWLFEFNVWEQILTPRHGWPATKPHVWSCTMARAAYHGLPMGLAELGPALGLDVVKQATGREIMLRMSRPRADGTWWHNDTKSGWDRAVALAGYCMTDVATEARADLCLPELPASERGIFLLDGKINQRGIRLDLTLVDRLQAVTEDEINRLNREISLVTNGAVATVAKLADMRAWLGRQGTEVASLDKAAVTETLSGHLAPPARDCLTLRQEAAKSSTAKLRSMVASASRDERARGLFQFYGAGRTGRWAGRRVQPQNLPRPTLKPDEIDAATASVMQGRQVSLDTVASCLRGCLVASPGNLLVAGDLAQIEARVLAWLSGQQDVLDVFARGADVYTYMAHKLGSKSRLFGKVIVLACGFGMGPDKFLATAATYGLALDYDQAHAAVYGWRAANPKSVDLWYSVERNFKVVAGSRHGTCHRIGLFRLGLLEICKTGQAVRIGLPSGRELVYQKVQVLDGQITYQGVHQTTRRWGEIRTWGGKLVENVVQAIARDVLAQAMVVLDTAGHDIIGSIHDEILLEAPAADAPGVLARALTVLRTPPAWAVGLPLDAEGWTGPRYRKA